MAKEIDRLKGIASRLSALRLMSFGAFLAGFFLDLEWTLRVFAVSSPALGLFGAALLLHERTLDRKQKLENEKLLLLESCERLRTRRRERSPPRLPPHPTPLEAGLRVHAPEPPSFGLDEGIVEDLNILESSPPLSVEASGVDERRGARTLFAFLDWSSSCFGSRRLLHMLLHPLREDGAISLRQEAVKEMAARPEARKHLLLSLLPLRRHALDPLARFFSQPHPFAGRRWLFLWANFLGSLTPLTVLAVVFTGRLVLLPILFFLIILSMATIAIHVKESNATRDRILLFGPLLDALLRLEGSMATDLPTSTEWRGIQEVLTALRPHAKRLRKYIHLLGLHAYGVIFEIINVVVLWELRILPLADKILSKHGDLLERAMGALGEAEAILSLSLPLAEQEGFELPEILSGPRPIVHADELAHPLLEPEAVVRNPVSLGEGANVLIVTGSNMSGKSTYLKSVALNLVLAGAGGPVCASGFRWTPLALHSDVNVRDSLDDGKSYFLVEVERVHKVIQAAARSTKVFAIFDELFRGTNSDERIALSRAVIRYLRSTESLLIVATHDLSLTRLVSEEREPGIENRHFQEKVENGVLRFDYRLREGPATTRNAILVVEACGFPGEIIREARGSG